jgi:hypothetical protein
MNGWHAAPAAALAVIFACGNAWAENGKFSLSSGINYSTGKYGQDSATDIVSVPVTGKLEIDAWTMKLSVPYVSVTGPGNVVQGIGAIGGRPVQSRTTESGLGDVVASVTRNVYEGNAAALDVTGKVKFGTADADRGLGTGENDFSLAVEPSTQWGDITIFGTLGYKVVGDPQGSDLDNVVFASLGGAAKITEVTSAGLSFDVQSRSSAAAQDAPRELGAFVNHRVAETWRAQAYVSRGLSEASPDWSGGATAIFTF